MHSSQFLSPTSIPGGGEGLIASSECLPLHWVEVGEGLIYIIHRVSPSTLGSGGGGARFHRQSVSLYFGGRGSFALSESLPLPWVEVGEGLICNVRVSPSTLGGGGGRLHRQSVSLYFGGRGSFASSDSLPLPWVEVGEGLICNVRVSPLPGMEVGEGLVCTIRVPPTTLGGGRGGARLHRQSVSLYLGWRWGRGYVASFTMSLPLPGMEVGMGLVYTVRVSPCTLGGGGARLYHQSISLYRRWRWWWGSFTSSTECLPLPWW